MTKNLKKENPKLYRARALRQAYLKLGHNISVPEILKQMEASEICPYCGKPIPLLDFSIDHIRPKQKGGSNAIENLHLIDKRCNTVKASLTDSEFRKLMAFLKENPEIYENLYRRLRMSGMVFTFSRRKRG